ncbi:MAG: hypothetical protein AAGB04_04965 [Pseudomonadota bacterium]
MFLASIHLTPLTATTLILVAVIAGYRYRQNWQQEGPLWKAWLYGIIAGGSLVVLAFTPLHYGS